MRLTNKKINYLDMALKVKDQGTYNESIYNKLGQLEDIEEELGIDLITLVKALKDGFYFKDDFGNIDFITGGIIKRFNKDKYEELMKDLHNYGKTWALTKEELL